jgi:hypothetical protein
LWKSSGIEALIKMMADLSGACLISLHQASYLYYLGYNHAETAHNQQQAADYWKAVCPPWFTDWFRALTRPRYRHIP